MREAHVLNEKILEKSKLIIKFLKKVAENKTYKYSAVMHIEI